MTDIAVVEESIDECQRYLTRAEKALESLQRGEDNNTYTAAMKRASLDLSNSLVAVRGNNKEAREKPPKNAVNAPAIPTREEIEQDIKDNTYTCKCCQENFTILDESEPHKIEGEVYCNVCFSAASGEFTEEEELHQTETANDRFIKSLPLRTCFKCGQKFHSENPCKWKGEIHCDDCFDLVSHGPAEKENEGDTHPDSDRFLCSHCSTLHKKIDGTLSSDGSKICKKCFEIELAQREQKQDSCKQPVQSTEQPSNGWVNIKGVKALKYRIFDDAVELQKDTVDCDKWSFDIIYSLLDMSGRDRSKEIQSLTEGQTYSQKRATALNQLVNAIGLGEVKLPGGEE